MQVSKYRSSKSKEELDAIKEELVLERKMVRDLKKIISKNGNNGNNQNNLLM